MSCFISCSLFYRLLLVNSRPIVIVQINYVCLIRVHYPLPLKFEDDFASENHMRAAILRLKTEVLALKTALIQQQQQQMNPPPTHATTDLNNGSLVYMCILN